jgi:hypothetical protein
MPLAHRAKTDSIQAKSAKKAAFSFKGHSRYKIKNLIQANTSNVNITGTDVGGIKVDLTHGQVYVPSLYQVQPGSSQSLYIADVKNIVKIIDTGAPSIGAIDAMLTNSALILPVIGLVFVIESLSVILQLLSKKIRGKKIKLIRLRK